MSTLFGGWSLSCETASLVERCFDVSGESSVISSIEDLYEGWISGLSMPSIAGERDTGEQRR